MKVGQKATFYKPQWHSTLDFFGEMSPQPEIEIKPLTWEERALCAEDANEIKMVPHPDVPDRLIPADHFNRWKCNRLLLYAAITGLKHFEYNDDRPIPATKEGLDFLIENLGADFVLWLQQLIVTSSDAADAAASQRKQAAAKNS